LQSHYSARALAYLLILNLLPSNNNVTLSLDAGTSKAKEMLTNFDKRNAA
jgi:hypothetical protein